MRISGNLVDIHARDVYPAVITVGNGIIENIERVDFASSVYIMPGLTDAHIHIESSMITPGAFAMTAVTHGTCNVVSDPHEIANVLGVSGVEFMIRDSCKVPLRFFFGAPSCVPATNFESNGAIVGTDEINKLLGRDEIKYLSEMMNFPGVIYNDPVVMRKIQYAKERGKPVDGHAPGLTGSELRKYVSAGISTDHECSTLQEALEKIDLGMKILIREGSAARNLDSLKELFRLQPSMVMLCSDDLHPEMLEKRHINKLIGKLISEGYDKFDVIRSATVNPSLHYGLNSGLLRVGDRADFVIAGSLESMNILETWINGVKVYSEGKVLFSYSGGSPVNKFNCSTIKESDLAIKNPGGSLRVITASEGELLTGEVLVPLKKTPFVLPDTGSDVLKIVVKDRYNDAPPAIGFIRGFGLKKGAFASSIAHDSHNIIAVGTNDHDIAESINSVVKMRGGLAVAEGNKISSVQLDIGGIMTTRSCREISGEYENLNKLTYESGCTMKAPFMTLSFMALLVIPDLKIGDRGLFDVRKFQPVSLFA